MNVEYIDKRQLLRELTELKQHSLLTNPEAKSADVFNSVKKLILDTQPESGIARVVRCKDCVHRGDVLECPMLRRVGETEEGFLYEDLTVDEGFCSCATKRVVVYPVKTKAKSEHK